MKLINCSIDYCTGNGTETTERLVCFKGTRQSNLTKFMQIYSNEYTQRIRSFYSQIALKTLDPTPNVRPLRLLDATVSLRR
jgi:hypothetical protein